MQSMKTEAKLPKYQHLMASLIACPVHARASKSHRCTRPPHPHVGPYMAFNSFWYIPNWWSVCLQQCLYQFSWIVQKYKTSFNHHPLVEYIIINNTYTSTCMASGTRKLLTYPHFIMVIGSLQSSPRSIFPCPDKTRRSSSCVHFFCGPCCSREGAGVAPNCVGKKECSRFGDIYGSIYSFSFCFFCGGWRGYFKIITNSSSFHDCLNYIFCMKNITPFIFVKMCFARRKTMLSRSR